MILLISSSFYYFYREFLALSPEKTILKSDKKRKLGLEEITFIKPYAKGNYKTGQKGKVC